MSNEKEESMKNESELDAILTPKSGTYSASPRRIEKIVKTARREVSFRDFLTLALLNIWKPLISIGAIFFVFCNRQPSTHSKQPEA